MITKYFIINIFVLCLVNLAYAQENLDAKASEPETAKPQVSNQDHRLYKGLNVFVGAGASVISNNIEGVGMSSKLPNTLGSNYAGEINYGLSESNTSLHVRHSVSSVRYEDVSGVRPSSFNQKNSRTDMGFTVSNMSSRESGVPTFGLGYYFVERAADRVSPAVAGTSYISGPTVSVGYVNDISAKVFYESGITLGFPNSFQESNTVTGRYKFGISGVLTFKSVFVYTENLDIALGLLINYDRVSFSGSEPGAGGRGVSDATEQFLNFIVPFELRFKF